MKPRRVPTRPISAIGARRPQSSAKKTAPVESRPVTARRASEPLALTLNGNRIPSIEALLESVTQQRLYDAFSPDADGQGEWIVRKDVHDACLAFIKAGGLKRCAEGAESLSLHSLSEGALRWLAEQEYVIGTVLLSCAPRGVDYLYQKVAQLVLTHCPHLTLSAVSRLHPIACTSLYITLAFPQWGKMESFFELWDSQSKLITSVASPSSQHRLCLPDGAVLSSAMECGNLQKVERRIVHGSVLYLLWTEGDAQTDKRLWFRFSISNFNPGAALCFRIMNLSPNAKLYRNGMRPVWMCPPIQSTWKQVSEVSFVISDDDFGQLSFYIVLPPTTNPRDELQIAFTVPYSYGDLLRYITEWHHAVRHGARNIRFEERVLCRTPDQRKLHLFIITSQTNILPKKAAVHLTKPNVVPFSSFDGGKRVVLVSGRVHPGEVSASHALHGLVSFLVSSDPRAAILREHFIFFIVPMLNPDGVARGHTRLDQKGNNLNRCYTNPTPVDHPTVYALKNVYEHLQSTFGDRFTCYLDFHSHVSQRKAFVYGNYLPQAVQPWNLLFAKLIELHVPHLFDFDGCRFSRADMQAKEGTSRVLFGAGVINSYTVEVAHFSLTGNLEPAVPTQKVAPKETAPPEGGDSASAETPQIVTHPGEIFSDSADIGRACLFALLDYCQLVQSEQLRTAGGIEFVSRQMKTLVSSAVVRTRRN